MQLRCSTDSLISFTHVTSLDDTQTLKIPFSVITSVQFEMLTQVTFTDQKDHTESHIREE